MYMKHLEQYAKTMVDGEWTVSASVDSIYVTHVSVDGVETEDYTEIDPSLNIDIEANRFVKEMIVKLWGEMDVDNKDEDKERDLNALSLHCNGQPLDESPIEWQRMVEDMYKRGIRFEVMV